jgi:hypothetical protein
MLLKKIIDTPRQEPRAEKGFTVSNPPYAASLPPQRRAEEGSLARLWREGNPPEADERSRTCPCESRDDALVVDQDGLFCLHNKRI